VNLRWLHLKGASYGRQARHSARKGAQGTRNFSGGNRVSVWGTIGACEHFASAAVWKVKGGAPLDESVETIRHYTSRRPSMALSMVTSSVYSMSLPTGIPMAMRVTRSPWRLSCWAR